ncbi:MAG: GIY-YIG nuclease family protein [Candidatus Saccharimonadales bacterium]
MPRNIQVFLPDGTLEGIRVIELSESNLKAFVIPRIKLNNVKDRPEVNQPALYFLIGSSENQLYIGESENFFDRIKNHDQSKDFWDTVIAVVSNTNILEKSDVKYLESLAVEKAKASAAMDVINKTIPVRNNIHEFKVHTLLKFLEDAAMVAELLGFSIFATKDERVEDTWYCRAKESNVRAQFRGDKFIVLAGSVIDKTYAPSWAKNWPKSLAERSELFEKYGKDLGKTVELAENVPFKSPNHAGGFVTGHSINAWTTWKNKDGKTMDEVMRKASQ